VVLSGHAVQDIHENFPLAICGHVNPPYVWFTTLHQYGIAVSN